MISATFRKRMAARLPKGSIARSIITLASGTALAQVIAVCAMPIVTRLYSPAQIGIISLFLSFFGFWAATLSLRYEYALLIAKDDAESHVIHRLAVLLVVVMSVLGLPILWCLWHFEILGFELLPNWAPFVAVPILLGYGLFMVYRSWALRAGLVKPITHSTIARSGARAGIQVILGLLTLGVSGLFAAELAAAWGALASLRTRVTAQFRACRPRRITSTMLRDVFLRYVKFPTLETPSTFVNQLALTLPVPMIASLHGPAAAGWYGLARAVVAIPNAQIGDAVADVLQMELAKALAAGDQARGRRLFYTLLGKLSVLGLLPLVGVVALAPWLMPFIFGTGWAKAGWAAAIIAPWLYAAFVVSPLSRLLSVLQAQEFKLAYDSASVTLLIGAFFIAKVYRSTFLEMICLLSVAGFVAYVIYLIILVSIVESKLKK